jgi:DNA-binding transcriptional MerR regulator
LEKSPEAFRTISEVADELEVPKHVLRFWEGKFSQVRPMKRGGGRRYYRPEDVELLKGIRRLLYDDGYTIKGVQRILREQGVRYVMECWSAPGEDEPSIKDIPDVASEAARRAAAAPVSISGRPLGERGPALAAPGRTLTRDDVNELTSTLAEIEACQRLLAQGRGEGDGR